MRWLLALVLLGGCAKQQCKGGQPNCCRSSDDCDSASICFPPSGIGCVIQNTPLGNPPCSVDSDCADAGATQVCVQLYCTSSLGKSCIAGCKSDADCAEGQQCAAPRCVPRPCSAGCPSLFTCDASTSTCARYKCKSDSDCPSGGVCLGDDGCQKSLGQCGLID